MHFCLVKATPLVGERDLFWLARVLEAQNQEFSVAWNLSPCSFDVVEFGERLPDFAQPMVFVDDDSDPGALAVHFVDPLRLQAAARVYVPRASGFNSGPYSVTAAASHEALEAAADPGCDLWRDHPDPARKGVQIALEVADPPQTEYDVPGHDGDVLVANYVLPSYFDATLFDPTRRAEFLKAGGKFDRKGELTAPGEVGPQGYVILRNDEGIWTEERPVMALVEGEKLVAKLRPDPRKKPGANHPWARTTRRLAK